MIKQPGKEDVIKKVIRLLDLSLIALTVIGCFFAYTKPTEAAVSQWSMGYYRATRTPALPVSAIQWTGLTHIIHNNGFVRSDGTLATPEGNIAADLVTTAHAHNVKALLGLSGNNGESDLNSAVENHLPALIANIMTILTTYGYDGVDIDWEPSGGFINNPTSATDMTTLASALRTAYVEFGKEGAKVLDHALPPHDLNGKNISRDKLEYDSHGAAFRFDDAASSTDYLGIADRQGGTLNLGRGDLSGSAWIWLNSLKDEEIFHTSILSKYAREDLPGFNFGLSSSNALVFSMSDGSTSASVRKYDDRFMRRLVRLHMTARNDPLLKSLVVDDERLCLFLIEYHASCGKVLGISGHHCTKSLRTSTYNPPHLFFLTPFRKRSRLGSAALLTSTPRTVPDA